MRDILLDQLLNDFYNSAFPGFTSKLTIGDPVLSTPVPVVDIPMHLDTDLLLEYAKQIELDPMQRTTYPYEQHPRFVGWNIQVLWSNDYNNTLLGDIYYKKTTAPVADKSATGTSELIQQYLQALGLDCTICMLSVFEPGAYLRPHRDIGLNSTPLNYFWLPLNNPIGSRLRVYPMGDIDITLGHLYLLNQENFVHGAVNYGQEPRYVLVGHLNNISTEFEQQILNSILKQYNQNI